MYRSPPKRLRKDIDLSTFAPTAWSQDRSPRDDGRTSYPIPSAPTTTGDARIATLAPTVTAFAVTVTVEAATALTITFAATCARRTLVASDVDRVLADPRVPQALQCLPVEIFRKLDDREAVSYTHLTLPTNREV